jgi:leucyl-tRNA synthetase
MKKLSAEESKTLSMKAKGRQTDLSAMLMSLEVGETVVVSKTEWIGKSSPYHIAKYVAQKKGWKFKNGRLPNQEGWAMQRIG